MQVMRTHYRQMTLLVAATLVTMALFWFAVSSYYSALPVAETLQRGTALSLGQAIEGVASHDPSFKALAAFRTPELAYFALIDRSGVIRFHTNPELIGEQIQDQRYGSVFEQGALVEKRVRLGTGEEVYETNMLLHLPNSPLVLRLALHSWLADRIVRRAQAGMLLVVLLTAAAWGLGLFSLRLVRREALQREALVKSEHLARLGELGAVMAHEVRTPLAGIKGFAQLLQERATDRHAQQATAAIVRETVRLERLVNDLLVYARPDGLQTGDVALDQVLAEAWQMVSPSAAVGVSLELSGERGLMVACPAERCVQLAGNLFTNALQAMSEGGVVRVTTTAFDDQVQMTVVDTGPGFDEQLLPRIFEPFVTSKATGGGLGLAVCRRIVEGCGGTITAANGPSGGAVVTVRLPRSRRKEQL